MKETLNIPTVTPQTTRATDRAVHFVTCLLPIVGEEPSAPRRARPQKRDQARFVSNLIRELAATTSMFHDRCATFEHPGT